MKREPRNPEEQIPHGRDHLYRKRTASKRRSAKSAARDNEVWVRADQKPAAKRSSYTAAAPERKKKRGAGKGFRAFLCILLVLIAGLAVIWAVPGWRTAAAKAVLKSPLGVPAASLFLGGKYNRYVRDKEFDESGVVIHSGIKVPEGNRTIALFGLDARSEDLAKGARSDSLMVVNVSSEGNIRMASVYRDTYLMMRKSDGTEIVTKANAAYAVGGPIAAVNMLNENFDLGITDYIVINFWGMESIIDLLGGLDISVTEEEMGLLNAYLQDYAAISGTAPEMLVSYGEKVHLSGAQATAFCRLRYIDFYSPLDGQTYTGDYGRAARQRYVLTELLLQTKSKGMLFLLTKAGRLFAANRGDEKFIRSSMTITELAGLLIDGSEMNLEAGAGFPSPEHQYTAYLDSGDTVVPDTLEENAEEMHQFLYGPDGYMPTDQLRETAERIRNEVARQTG